MNSFEGIEVHVTWRTVHLSDITVGSFSRRTRSAFPTRDGWDPFSSFHNVTAVCGCGGRLSSLPEVNTRRLCGGRFVIHAEPRGHSWKSVAFINYSPRNGQISASSLLPFSASRVWKSIITADWISLITQFAPLELISKCWFFFYNRFERQNKRI